MKRFVTIMLVLMLSFSLTAFAQEVRMIPWVGAEGHLVLEIPLGWTAYNPDLLNASEPEVDPNASGYMYYVAQNDDYTYCGWFQNADASAVMCIERSPTDGSNITGLYHYYKIQFKQDAEIQGAVVHSVDQAEYAGHEAIVMRVNIDGEEQAVVYIQDANRDYLYLITFVDDAIESLDPVMNSIKLT